MISGCTTRLTLATSLGLKSFHTCAVTADKGVRCWGSSDGGQLNPPAGLGPVAQVAVGEGFSCVLLVDKTAVCWPPKTTGGTPVRVPPNLPPLVQIAANGYDVCALAEDQSMVCWGQNGDGVKDNIPDPAVQKPGAVVQVTGSGAVTTDMKAIFFFPRADFSDASPAAQVKFKNLLIVT